MAVAWFRNPVLDETAELIERNTVNDRTFGVTTTKRHPAYVYSINGNACLMHKIRDVEIHWHALVAGGSKLGRLKQPAMIAHTICSVSMALTPKRSRTCHVPFPGAVLCGRCHGEPPTFAGRRKQTKDGISKQEAHVRLGCVVAGYPSALARDTQAADAVDPHVANPGTPTTRV